MTIHVCIVIVPCSFPAAPVSLCRTPQLLPMLLCLLYHLQAASTCAAYTAALLALESLLSQPELQPAPLNSQWQGQWQQRWRHSLAAAGPGSWEALLLHLALLGRHVVHGEWQIGREGFMRLAAACKWVAEHTAAPMYSFWLRKQAKQPVQNHMPESEMIVLACKAVSTHHTLSSPPSTHCLLAAYSELEGT